MKVGERQLRVAALLLVAAAALLAARPLFAPGLHPAHDSVLNVYRSFEMQKCLVDAQLPCRWAPDMGYGFGAPLFLFYPPLPAYLAQPAILLGMTHVGVVKLEFALALLAGGLGCFGLARRFYGSSGGLVAAFLYVWAPYQATDVYVRGALGESCGLALVPWVFLAGMRAIQGKRGGALGCAFAWAALLLTHDLVALMIGAPYALWCALQLRHSASEARPGALARFVAAHLLAIGLSASFVFPLIAERGFAHTETLTTLYEGLRVENNFLGLRQVLGLPEPWGYAPFGAAQGMALAVGPLQWVLGSLGLLAAIAGSLRRGALSPADRTALLLGLSAWGALAMTLSLTQPIYELFSPLAMLQFPWRFLGLASFGFAMSAATLPALLPRGRGLRETAAVAIAGLAVVIALPWFQPQRMIPIAPETLASEEPIRRARHGLFDFMPAGVDIDRFPREAPATPGPIVKIVQGKGARIESAERGSDWFAIEVQAPEGALLRLHAFRFPDWRASSNGEPLGLAEVADPLARIHVRVPAGRSRVDVRLEATPLRRFSDFTSLATLLGVLAYCARSRSREVQ